MAITAKTANDTRDVVSGILILTVLAGIVAFAALRPKLKASAVTGKRGTVSEEIRKKCTFEHVAANEQAIKSMMELKDYLKGNLDYLRDFLKEKLPQVKLIEPEGTYLIWLDMRELGLSPEDQDRLMAEDAKVWLDTGTMFGEEGAGFERINIACPRATLEEALNRMEKAING